MIDRKMVAKVKAVCVQLEPSWDKRHGIQKHLSRVARVQLLSKRLGTDIC